MFIVNPFTTLSLAFMVSQVVDATPSLKNQRQSPTAACISSTFQKALGPYAILASPPHTEVDDPILRRVPSAGITDICAVLVNVTAPDSTNTFQFEVWLPPAQRWNSRLLTFGNYGFVGGISRYDMFSRLVHGFATMSTDTGHGERSDADPSIMAWALNDKDKQRDWGYRAMELSVPLAKNLTNAYYETQGLSIARSYYSGCSTGGRQGLKQIQRAADSFDGLLIGAPAWDTKHLMPWISRVAEYNLDKNDADRLDLAHSFLVFTAILEACDVINQPDTAPEADDDIVQSPAECAQLMRDISRWDGVLCDTPGAPNPPTCVTPTQRDNFLDLVNDTYFDGQLLHEGFDITAAQTWTIGYLSRDETTDQAEGFDQDWMRYFILNEPAASVERTRWASNAEEVVAETEKWDAETGMATADQFRLSDDFRGKIVMYHGFADGTVPTRSSERYYASTRTAYGGDVDGWFRYFLVPGMEHCFQTYDRASPWYFGGVGLHIGYPNIWYVPDGLNLTDTDHDAFLALISWVEDGNATAVDSITATAFETGTVENGTFVPYRQRPICPWEQMPRWDGEAGTENNVTHWYCG